MCVMISSPKACSSDGDISVPATAPILGRLRLSDWVAGSRTAHALIGVSAMVVHRAEMRAFLNMTGCDEITL